VLPSGFGQLTPAMHIDWFTFAAQIINFLILVALLKRFLYGPILKAIEDRESEIVSQFAAAELGQATAEETRQELLKQLDDLATARLQLLAEATEDVERWKQERLDEAQAGVNEVRSDWFATLDREREQLRSKLLAQYRQHALRMARGVLDCLADAGSQKLLVDAFVRQLATQRPGDSSPDQFQPGRSTADKPDKASGRLTVWSAFELTPDQQQQLSDALSHTGTDRTLVDFRVDDSLICGIKIRSRDHEISWNASDSLNILEEQFSHDLDEALSVSNVQAPISMDHDSDDVGSGDTARETAVSEDAAVTGEPPDVS
jgi:F-type H+-transporting ATPase subunit b